MDVTYSFSLGPNSGSFRIEFFFSTPSRFEVAKNDAELTFEVSRVVYDDKVNSDAKKAVASQITICLRAMVEVDYSRVIEERAEAATA